MSRITGFDAANLIEAYNAVYAPQEEVELTEEQIQEDFENWVNSLVEEGHDLSEYTWEDMYEAYIEEQGGRGESGAMQRNQSVSLAPIGNAARGAVSAVTGAAERFGSSVNQSLSAANRVPTSNASRNVRGGGARGSRGPVVSQRPAPSRFGTTTPRGSSVTSTGVSGLSAADRAAYSAGGGNTAAQRGMGQTTSQVIAQGRANLNRMDQGRPAPARPVATAPARPAATAPARPAATAPAAPRPTPAATAPAAPRPTPAATAPSAPAAPRPSLAQQRSELEQIRKKSQQRQIAQGGTPATPLVQSFDPFDVVMGYLIDEGYAETEEAAAVIMTNMSEEWREEILEGKVASETMGSDERRRERNDRYREENPTLPSGNPTGVNAQLMRQMAHAKKRGVKKKKN